MGSKSLFVIAFIFSGFFLFVSCDGTPKDEKTTKTETTANNQQKTANDQSEVHGSLVKPEDITITTPLNAQWVTSGKSIYALKCQSCHKLNEERVVGPGWAGVTKRREPHWIMNMITNVETMLENDPEAQKLLEQCLVRMPNQNISKDESRQVLEFMRSNDGVK